MTNIRAVFRLSGHSRPNQETFRLFQCYPLERPDIDVVPCLQPQMSGFMNRSNPRSEGSSKVSSLLCRVLAWRFFGLAFHAVARRVDIDVPFGTCQHLGRGTPLATLQPLPKRTFSLLALHRLVGGLWFLLFWGGRVCSTWHGFWVPQSKQRHAAHEISMRGSVSFHSMMVFMAGSQRGSKGSWYLWHLLLRGLLTTSCSQAYRHPALNSSPGLVRTSNKSAQVHLEIALSPARYPPAAFEKQPQTHGQDRTSRNRTTRPLWMQKQQRGRIPLRPEMPNSVAYSYASTKATLRMGGPAGQVQRRGPVTSPTLYSLPHSNSRPSRTRIPSNGGACLKERLKAGIILDRLRAALQES